MVSFIQLRAILHILLQLMHEQTKLSTENVENMKPKVAKSSAIPYEYKWFIRLSSLVMLYLLNTMLRYAGGKVWILNLNNRK